MISGRRKREDSEYETTPSTQNSNDPPYFVISPNDGIDLPFSSQFRQIDCILLQGIKAFLCTFAVNALVTSNLLNGSSENWFGKPSFLDDRCYGGVLYKRKEKVILSKICIMHIFLLLLCLMQDLDSGRAERDFIWSWRLRRKPDDEFLKTTADRCLMQVN